MSALEEVCEELVTRLEGAVLCGVVNLESRTLLGLHSTRPVSAQLNDAVCSMSVELFAGTATGRAASLLHRSAATRPAEPPATQASPSLPNGKTPPNGTNPPNGKTDRAAAEPPEGRFDEVQVASRENYHFAKILNGGQTALLLVTRKTTNLGLAWAHMKATANELEPHVP